MIGSWILWSAPLLFHFLDSNFLVVFPRISQTWVQQHRDGELNHSANTYWLGACMQSCFSLVWLFATLWTIACQASLSMGFCRQDYWSGLPCPPPGDLPDPGIEPTSLTSPALARGFFTASTTWQAHWLGTRPYWKCWREQPENTYICNILKDELLEMELLGLWTRAFKNFLNIVKLMYKVYYSLDACFWMCNFLKNFIEVWLIWILLRNFIEVWLMAGWHHWLDGHESQWTPGVGDGQGGLACCDSWGRKKSDTTERLIWSDLMVDLQSVNFCLQQSDCYTYI